MTAVFRREVGSYFKGVLGYLLAEGLADSAGAGGTEAPEEEKRVGFE